MTHLRTEIRKRIAEHLTVSGTQWQSVYDGHARPITNDQAKSRHIVISTPEETIDYAQGQLGSIPMRQVTVQIDGYYKNTASAQVSADELDKIDAEIETLMYSPAALIPNAVGIELAGMTQDLSADGDGDLAQISIQYLISYMAQEGAPETTIT